MDDAPSFFPVAKGILGDAPSHADSSGLAPSLSAEAAAIVAKWKPIRQSDAEIIAELRAADAEHREREGDDYEASRPENNVSWEREARAAKNRGPWR